MTVNQVTQIRNTFTPTTLIPDPYGWKSAPPYNRADVPATWVNTSVMTADQLAASFAYEWLDAHQISRGFSNPPFTTGAAGRLHPLLKDSQGNPARILRGFIRRAEVDPGDPASKGRLYFMYNPEVITRDYVS